MAAVSVTEGDQGTFALARRGQAVGAAAAMTAWFHRLDALVADAPVSLLLASGFAVGAGLVVVLVLVAGRL